MQQVYNHFQGASLNIIGENLTTSYAKRKTLLKRDYKVIKKIADYIHLIDINSEDMNVLTAPFRVGVFSTKSKETLAALEYIRKKEKELARENEGV